MVHLSLQASKPIAWLRINAVFQSRNRGFVWLIFKSPKPVVLMMPLVANPIHMIIPELLSTIHQVMEGDIPQARKEVLHPLIAYIQQKVNQDQTAYLNFICTHNSRRSQFAQIWAQTAADYLGIDAVCFSGGVEVTAFNERAVAALKLCGFKVSSSGGENPVYSVFYAEENAQPIQAFSKLFDDPANKAPQFAAVMTCSDADENCPFIPGTEKRIAVRYEDPKVYDGTPLEGEMYYERCLQIATEMFYVFSNIKRH